MKKGRVSVMTRPKPTIYGNCDSWNSIVGKKGVGLAASDIEMPALQVHNGHVIHRLSTTPCGQGNAHGWAQ